MGCNFSLKYPYIILHTGNKNTQTNQAEVVILIQHQILATNLQEDVLQLEGRINNQIWGLTGLMEKAPLPLGHCHCHPSLYFLHLCREKMSELQPQSRGTKIKK